MAQSISINGKTYDVDLDDDTPMLWVLRDACALTGTKYGCGIAMCGACTIHVDGAARRSCVTPIANIGGAKVRTIEALHESAVGRALQRAWRELEVPQCGYCQSGQLMSAAVLLETTHRTCEPPSRASSRERETVCEPSIPGSDHGRLWLAARRMDDDA